MCVSVTGPLEFANGNLVGTAWFKPGLGESPVIVVLFFAPCTAGGVPAWMFTFASVLSIVPLLTVRLVWFCFVVFGEGSAVFSVSLASVKRTEAVTGSLVEDKTGPFGPTVKVTVVPVCASLLMTEFNLNVDKVFVSLTKAVFSSNKGLIL